MNRGIYIVFKSVGKFFVNESSETFLFLKNIFLASKSQDSFDFNSSANFNVPKIVLESMETKLDIEIEQLIKTYHSKKVSGLNFVEETYKDISYKLFYKSSDLHRQLWWLFKFAKRLKTSISKNYSVHIIGNAGISESQITEMHKIKHNDKKTLKEQDLNILKQLEENECIQIQDGLYELTLKGQTIEIAEK